MRAAPPRRRAAWSGTLFFLMLLSPVTTLGQTDLPGFEDRRALTAVRLEPGESVRLDGILSEPVWRRAEPAGEFVQVDPDNGAPATEPTEVFIAFDEHSLYLAVVCHDSEPERLIGNSMLRDAPLSGDDRFMWVLDPFLDERTGYFFEINPSGAMGDSLIGTNQRGGGRGGGGGGGRGGGGGGGRGNQDAGRAWDGIWTAHVVRSEIGWTAEIEIPFRTLNFDANSPAWGINFQRTISRKNEETIWNGYSRDQSLQRMSNAGLMLGLEDISQGLGFDVKPYVVASALRDRTEPAGGTQFEGDGGVDLIYNLTSGLRANFTVNTDFAETEVDDRQVNLTRFPLRFPEKREFFLEGSNFFDFTGYDDAFFSRRIGLNEGVPQRIDYGVKLTGQAGAYDLGLLQVRTGEETVLTSSEDTGEDEERALLGENFTVFRGRRRLLSESHIGMLYTRRASRQTSGNLPSLFEPPGEALETLGFDLRLATRRFMDNKNLAFESHYLHTTNPDGTGRSGRYGFGIDFPNDLINARANFDETQANFDPAVGFIQRRGVKTLDTFFQFKPRPADNPWIRQFSFGVGYDMIWDSRNLLLERQIQITALQIDFQSGDNVRFRIQPHYELLDTDFPMDFNRETDEFNIVLPAGSEYRYLRYNVQGGMSNRRPVSLRGFFSWGEYLSGRRRDFGPQLAIRPRDGLLVDLGAQFNRIELPEGSFSTSVLTGNISNQFSPWVSLSSNIQYDTVSRLIGWQARFRWILTPGNDLFLVYTHNWDNDPDGIATRDNKLASKFVFTHRF